jgi:hypothetical protein
MSKSRPQYLVSNDSIGFFGKPAQFLELWQEYFNDKTLDGVEVIAFKPLNQLNKLISTLKKNKIPVLSFHGKTGGEYRLSFSLRIIMTLVNAFIIDLNKLLENFPQIEFLSHTLYFEKKIIKQLILKEKPKTIWIENHSKGEEGVEEAAKEISLYRKNGINTLGMFDVYHFVSQMNLNELLQNWGKVVDQINNYFKIEDKKGKQIFTGIHFPAGTRMDDSLPIDKMTNSMLRLFAKKIIPRVDRVVFENQQKFPYLIFSSEKRLAEQKERNKRIIERLKKTGIIL